ncbi:hypothetical protein MRB53_030880 [Persea americana]|uniref:Uncharacterized protein n=1 Tax=Persea americana TaxID=3435 RepID=A0ACC2KMK6_PERAE|nr:hypothetical protein MRB53_030880 [Persea americana]
MEARLHCCLYSHRIVASFMKPKLEKGKRLCSVTKSLNKEDFRLALARKYQFHSHFVRLYFHFNNIDKRKIETMKIEDKQRRFVTLSKRKEGLFKKAKKLALDFGVEVAVIGFTVGGRPFSFGSDKILVDSSYHVSPGCGTDLFSADDLISSYSINDPTFLPVLRDDELDDDCWNEIASTSISHHYTTAL